MKTPNICFETVISEIDNDYHLCSGQKCKPQWGIHNRCASCKKTELQP